MSLDPLELIRDRADILEVVGEHVVLKRSGRNFLGLCPFHGEKTPSFNVNPEKRIFRCFGCGEGGDVFAFLMKLHSFGFREAMKLLAERYGIALTEGPEADDRAALRRANDVAQAFFRANLLGPAGAEARAYLERRGVSLELAERFGLGYALPEWDALARHLKASHVSEQVAEDAGLVRLRREGSGHYDYFRGRLIFPITADLGQVIAFGARAMKPEDEPKYLNSPDTLLYHKGRHLYALPLAREAVKARDRILLMEGYMDVIAAHQAGFTEAVGVLGTALTPAQVKNLLRYTRRVWVAYDADKAGQAATERGIATLEEVAGANQLEVRVLQVPAGKDPDEFIKAQGTAAFEALVTGASTLLQYQLDRAIAGVAHDLTTPEAKEAAVQAVKRVLARVPSKVLRDELYTQLARRLDVSRNALALEIDREFRHNGAPQRAPRVPTTRRDGLRQAEEDLLILMVEHNAVRSDVTSQLAGIPLAHEDCQWLRTTIEGWSAETELNWEALLREYRGEQEQRLISGLAFGADPKKWPEVAAAARSIIATVAIHFWSQEYATYTELLQAAIREGAPHDEIDEFLRQSNHALAQKEALKFAIGSVLPTRSVE